MSADPFDALRLPDEPVTPDAHFAAALRARIADALTATEADAHPVVELPDRRSTTMPDTSTSMAPAESGEFTSTVTPYLCVSRAVDALAWYADVFGAVETVRYTADDGRIGHAEISISGAKVMLSDEYPEIGVTSPTTIGGTGTALSLSVADVDAVHVRATAAGATSLRAPEDQPYGERTATIVDPFGHRWMIETTIAHPTVAEVNEAIEGYTVTEPGDG